MLTSGWPFSPLMTWSISKPTTAMPLPPAKRWTMSSGSGTVGSLVQNTCEYWLLMGGL